MTNTQNKQCQNFYKFQTTRNSKSTKGQSCMLLLSACDVCVRDGLDRSCLLRSVCEVSAAPIAQNNVVAELLQTLLTYVYNKFTPSYYTNKLPESQGCCVHNV